MTLDIDCDVAVQAVRSVIAIHKYHREVLSDNDCQALYMLVFSSRRAVAQAAGEFLNERLLTLDETSPPALRTHRGKTRLPSTPLIRHLIDFFFESEVKSQLSYNSNILINKHTS